MCITGLRLSRAGLAKKLYCQFSQAHLNYSREFRHTHRHNSITYSLIVTELRRVWSMSSAMGLPSEIQAKIDAVENVEIDADGRFKYVLIKLYHPDHEENFKYITRGFSWAEWHADIYDSTRERVEGLGLETECVGGGRILHESAKKSLKVFGYSQGFGKADHQITVDLLKKKYPGYSVSWSNDGY